MFLAVKFLNVHLEFNIFSFVFEVVVGVVVYIICLFLFKAQILNQLKRIFIN